ncbi:MAG: transcriptional regulator, partial [Rhodospirillaceae bacterium]|nr:transcriptional regulator [Rhodospirillaceae bacterium]
KVGEGIIRRLGNLERAYLIGDYADGKDSGIIDLLLVGDLDHYQLNDLSGKTERYIKRKIRTLVFSQEKYKKMLPELNRRAKVPIWENKT